MYEHVTPPVYPPERRSELVAVTWALSRKWIPRVARAIVFTAALMVWGLGSPVSAAASTVRVEADQPSGTGYPYGQWVKFSGELDAAHDVAVALEPSGYVITDASAPLTVGNGCTALNAHAATCVLTDPPQIGIYVGLGDLDDRFISTASTPSLVYGGDGNDTLEGGAGNDLLSGMSGTNAVRGGVGTDTLLAHGQIGRDTLAGGAGTDTVDYGDSGSYPPIGVVVSIDGQANDGYSGAPPEERDNVGVDVENVIGTSGDDVITGSASANSLDGAEGTDRLNGADGDDTFTIYDIRSEQATMSGGAGADTLDLSRSYISGITIALDGQSHDETNGPPRRRKRDRVDRP